MTQFDQIYQEALDLGTDKICRIKGDKCIAVRLGLKKAICNVCARHCWHFRIDFINLTGRCTIKNIGCKVWLCPQIEQFQTEEFKKKQESIMAKAAKLGLNKYCLTEEEIKSGVKQPFGSSSNKRLDKILSRSRAL